MYTSIRNLDRGVLTHSLRHVCSWIVRVSLSGGGRRGCIKGHWDVTVRIQMGQRGSVSQSYGVLCHCTLGTPFFLEIAVTKIKCSTLKIFNIIASFPDFQRPSSVILLCGIRLMWHLYEAVRCVNKLETPITVVIAKKFCLN